MPILNLDAPADRVLGKVLRINAELRPEATFLLWLDLRGTGCDVRELLVERARLGLGHGERFGAGGAGFARMCIACPRSILAEAFDRLDRALSR